jgi:hypothetical protein
MFFASVASKRLAEDWRVSVDSARLKVAVLSTSWAWLASADSKEVTGEF